MDTNNLSHQKRAGERATLEAKQVELLERAERRQRGMLCAWVATTAIALVATVTMLESCGSDNSHTQLSGQGGKAEEQDAGPRYDEGGHDHERRTQQSADEQEWRSAGHCCQRNRRTISSRQGHRPDDEQEEETDSEQHPRRHDGTFSGLGHPTVQLELDRRENTSKQRKDQQAERR